MILQAAKRIVNIRFDTPENKIEKVVAYRV